MNGRLSGYLKNRIVCVKSIIKSLVDKVKDSGDISGDTVVSRVTSISSVIERYTTPEKLPCIFTRADEMRAPEIFISKKRLNRSNSK